MSNFKQLRKKLLFFIIFGTIILSTMKFPQNFTSNLPDNEIKRTMDDNTEQDIISPLNAADISPWWNEIYEYRIKITVSANGVTQTDYPVELFLDFNQYFIDNGISISQSNRLNVSNIRIIEQTDTLIVSTDIPIQYDPSGSSITDQGELAWVIPGSFASSKDFYLYFCLGNEDSLGNPIVQSSYSRSSTYMPFRLHHEGFEYTTSEFNSYKTSLEINAGQTGVSGNPFYAYVQNTTIEGRRGNAAFTMSGNIWLREDIPDILVGDYANLYMTYSAYVYDVPSAGPAYTDYDIVGVELSRETSFSLPAPGVYGPQIYGTQDYYDISYRSSQNMWHNHVFDIKGHFGSSDYLRYIYFALDDDDGTGDNPDGDGDRYYADFPVTYDDISIWNVTVGKDANTPAIVTPSTLDSVFSNFRIDVLDLDGFPVPNAEVKIWNDTQNWNQTGFTDSQGIVVFSDVAIDQIYNISVNFQTEGIEVPVDFEIAFEENIQLSDFNFNYTVNSSIWSMDFRIQDYDGDPIENGFVLLYDGGLPVYNASLDSNGYTTIRYKNDSTSYDYKVFYDTSLLGSLYDFNEKFIEIKSGQISRISSSQGTWVEYGLVNQVDFPLTGGYTTNTFADFNTEASDFNNALIGTIHVDLFNFTNNIESYILYGYDQNDVESTILNNAGTFSSNLSFSISGLELTRFRISILDSGDVPYQEGVINVSYYLRSTELITCNISTISLNISGDTGDTIEPLANAIVLITNATNGQSIVNITTTTSGIVDFTYFRYTPSTFGNYSLQIKFVGTIAKVNKTDNPTDALGDWTTSQDFNIDVKTQKDVLVNFRDTSYISNINVTNIDPLIALTLTWGDLQLIQNNYTFIQGVSDPVSLPVDKMEYLVYDAELTLVYSGEMDWIQDGEYEFYFNSSNVIADTQYTIRFKATKEGYPAPTYKDEVRINVEQVPTTADVYDSSTGLSISGSEIEKKWGEVFNITVTYQKSGDLTYLSGADVILNWYFDSNLHMVEQSGNGMTNYTIQLNTSKVTSLDQYRIDISANLQNHTIQTLSFDVDVVELPTSINSEDYVERTLLYWKENLSINVNYTDTFNGETVSNAYVYYTVVGDVAFNEYQIIENGTSGIYQIEINSTQFGEAGNYTLQVVAKKDNYITQQMWVSFTIKIIPTTLDSIVTNSNPYWKENFTIQLNYTDTYYSLPISDIDILYSISGSSFTETGNMINSGDGIFILTYNTTHFPKAGIYSFEFIASKNNYQGRSLSLSIEIQIVPVNFTADTTQFNQQLNQLFTISVLAEDVRNVVSDPISSGSVSFTVTGPNNFVKTGFVSSVGNGFYNATFNTTSYFNSIAGTYSFQLVFTKNQYETSSLTITVNIAIIPTTLTTTSSVIDLFWEESFEISVRYLDQRDSTPLVGATISYVVTGPSSYYSTSFLPDVGNGYYSLTFESNSDFSKAGTYTFLITASIAEHQTKTLSITVNIEVVPTNLTATTSVINIYWGEGFDISVYFEDLRDLGDIVPIVTGATISYSITGPVGYSESGTLSHIALNPGTYRKSFISTDFNFNGTYNFQIIATKNQYETQTVSITVYINILPTDLTAEQNSISVNWGETFNLTTNFIDSYNSLAIDTNFVTYTVTGPNDFVDAGNLIQIEVGVYFLDFAAIEGGDFEAGTYYFQVTAQKSQYETQTITITVNIAVIDTSLNSLVGNQIIVPWENNFTISVYYFDEDNGLNITDGLVSYSVTGYPEFAGSISYSGSSSSYLIEFNTTSFLTTGTYSFSITASKNQYETQQIVINVDIGIRPINFTANATEISLYWGDLVTLAVNLFDIEDSENPIAIPDGNVAYSASGTNNYLDSGLFIYSGGNGIYELDIDTLDFNQAGSYTFQVTASKDEYASRTIVISIVVLKVPTMLTSPYQDDTIPLIWGEATTLNVSFSEIIDQESPNGISDASLTYYSPALSTSTGSLVPVGNGVYTFDIDSIEYSVAGTYNFRITTSKNQYEVQQLVIVIQISIVPTDFSTIQTNYTVTWLEALDLSVLFLDTYRDGGITDGNVSFSVGQQIGFSGEFTAGSNGEYTYLLNTSDFDGVGSYSINVVASKYQYASQSITFYLIINPIQTRINNTIFLRKDIQINVTTSHYFDIAYSDISGSLIAGANIAYFEWEDGTTTYSGTLSDLGTGFYRLDFNTLNRPIGTYLIAVYIGRDNYVQRSATITLEIVPRSIGLTLGSDISERIVRTPQGNQIIIELSLMDLVDDVPISGASISMDYRGNTITILETDTLGTYQYIIDTNSGEYDALVAAITDTATISISKTNYSINPFDIAISVTPPEFVIGNVGVPKIFVYIGGAVALLAIAIAGTTRYIRYARIPQIIKQIDHTRKLISGGKVIADENLTKSYEEEIVELYEDAWEILDLDLNKILGTNQSASNATLEEMGDTTEGGL